MNHLLEVDCLGVRSLKCCDELKVIVQPYDLRSGLFVAGVEYVLRYVEIVRVDLVVGRKQSDHRLVVLFVRLAPHERATVHNRKIFCVADESLAPAGHEVVIGQRQMEAARRIDGQAPGAREARGGARAVGVTRRANQASDQNARTIGGESVKDMINDDVWNRDVFLPTVGKRGAAIIEARGLSSAASAANAAIDHMRDWALGTNGKWVTMGIPSDGSYGIPAEVMYGVPVTCANGEYTRIEGLEVDAFSRERMDFTLNELLEERDGVKHLLP